MFDILITLVKQPILFFAVVSLGFYVPWQRFRPYDKTLLKLLVVLAGIAILYYLIISVSYVLCSSFLDHIEPTMLIQSLLAQDGKAIYTSPESENCISLIYGPSTTFFSTFLLGLFPDHLILVSKLSGFIMGIASIAILFYIFSKHSKYGLLAMAFSISLFLPFAHFSFWNRPDSLILLTVSMSLLSTQTKSKPFSILLFAVSLALAVNAKMHSIFYFIPVFYLYLINRGSKNLFRSLSISILLFFIPFLHPSFSITNYSFWIFHATTHNIIPYTLTKNLTFSLFFIAPLIVIESYLQIRHGLRPQYKKEIIILIVSSLPVIILGAKEGAGSHHIMPFAPTIVFLTLKALQHANEHILEKRARSRWFSFMGLIGFSWLITSILFSIKVQFRVIDHILSDNRKTLIQELTNIKKKYATQKIAMGYGGDNNYHFTFFRPLLYSTSHDYFLDAPAIMDMLKSDIPIPEQTLEKLKNQDYDLFVIPLGAEPFSMNTLYSPVHPLFTSDFRNIFSCNYNKIRETEHYSIWEKRDRP